MVERPGAKAAGRLLLVAGVLGACGGGQKPFERPVALGWGFAMRMSQSTEPLVDATFDREARGGRQQILVERAYSRATENMLLAARSDVAACFAEAAFGVSAIEVPVRFLVPFGGGPTNIDIEWADAEARACLEARLRRVRFPDPRPGHHFTVRYVLRFCAPAADCITGSDR